MVRYMYSGATMNSRIDYVKSYFYAWQTHSTDLLYLIFTPDAKYIIRNKARSYSGICEIAAYWERNKRRQKNLRLTWDFIECGECVETVVFRAQFEDIEEGERNSINGQITFVHDDTNRIVELSEEYQKIVIL